MVLNVKKKDEVFFCLGSVKEVFFEEMIFTMRFEGWVGLKLVKGVEGLGGSVLGRGDNIF